MKPPVFIREWIETLPYHQLSELTLWMDSDGTNLQKSIEAEIGASLDIHEGQPPYDEDVYDPADNGNQGS